MNDDDLRAAIGQEAMSLMDSIDAETTAVLLLALETNERAVTLLMDAGLSRAHAVCMLLGGILEPHLRD